MHSNGVGRRAVLVALVAAPVAGCSLFDDEPEQAPVPDPLAPMVADADRLASEYSRHARAHPTLAARLGPIGEAHRAHAAELSRITGTARPSGGVTVAEPNETPAESLQMLRDFETAAREAAVRACLTAPPERALLLGTIAAARATHLEALK